MFGGLLRDASPSDTTLPPATSAMAKRACVPPISTATTSITDRLPRKSPTRQVRLRPPRRGTGRTVRGPCPRAAAGIRPVRAHPIRPHRPARRACPSTASSRIMSPSRTLPSGPPPSASGEQWIAAGTLPDAPDMRPSVTSATLNPRSATRRGRGQLVEFGHAVGARALEAHDDDDVAVEFARLERGLDFGLVMEHARRAPRSSSARDRPRDTLMQARPRLPARMRKPPSGEKALAAGRRIVSSPLAPGVLPAQRIALDHRPLAIILELARATVRISP